MKIAFFSDCYLDLTGGIPAVMNSEKSELERRGHTVYVFTSAYPRSKKECQQLAEQHIYPVPSCRIFGRGLTPIARRPGVVEHWIMSHHPEIADFDAFYVHYEASCSIVGLRLGRRLHIPTVQVMHGREDVGESLIVPRGLRTIAAVLLNRFHSWYLPHPVKVRRDAYLAPTTARAQMWELMVNHANAADYVITPSDFFRRMLIHYGVERPIHPLHHAISDEYLNRNVPAKTRTHHQPLEIIWHSRLSPEKRPLVFLEALTHIKSRYHLSVYGDGIEMARAKAYADAHHLNVTFHGTASFDQIWEALQQSHLDVLVSYDFDTFGMTLIEAEASGTPVLICDPHLQEIIPEGGYFIAKSPSAVDIAEAIEYAVQPSFLADTSQVMRDSRSELRLSAKVDQLERIFSDIIRA